MTTLTITPEGQVTLHKELLQHLGLVPGDKVAVEQLPDGRIAMRAARRTGKISDAFGFLKNEHGVHLTIEEINEAAAEGWAGAR